jgi:hypothetical protein
MTSSDLPEGCCWPVVFVVGLGVGDIVDGL